MDAKSNAHVQWCNQLQHHGWDVDFEDSIKANTGSESREHLTAKALTFRYLKQDGYRVKTECSHSDRGAVDVLLIPPTTEVRPLAIELENNLTQEVKDDKLRRYTEHTPIRDVLFVEVTELSTDIEKMEDQLKEEIGL